MRLHGYWRSSAAYRVRIALNLKGLATDDAPVALRDGVQQSAEFKALNPQGLVPALQVDGAVLTQSLAIVEWLEEVHPTPPLLPADPVARAQVRGFAQIIACDIHPLQNLRVLNYLRGPLDQPQAQVDAWCSEWLGTGLAACEAIATRQDHGGAFTFGATPGLADLCLVPQLFSTKRLGVDTTPYPRLMEIAAACEALPAFAEAHPLRQSDAD